MRLERMNDGGLTLTGAIRLCEIMAQIADMDDWPDERRRWQQRAMSFQMMNVAHGEPSIRDAHMENALEKAKSRIADIGYIDVRQTNEEPAP